MPLNKEKESREAKKARRAKARKIRAKIEETYRSDGLNNNMFRRIHLREELEALESEGSSSEESSAASDTPQPSARTTPNPSSSELSSLSSSDVSRPSTSEGSKSSSNETSESPLIVFPGLSTGRPGPSRRIAQPVPYRLRRKKEQSADNNPFQEEAYLNRPEIRIPVPDHLKSILVDDWENVTKNLLLLSLPSKNPANKVIDDWFENEAGKRREGSAEMEILEEVHSGLKDYFKKALGRILLYRFEREQYSEMIALWDKAPPGSEWEGKGAGDVYGAEHLARLVGK